MSTIVNSMAQAINGRGPELHQLIAQFAQVADVYNGQASNMAAVIDGFGKLGATLAAHALDIGTFIDNMSAATATMAAQRTRFIVTIQRLTEMATAMNNNVLIPHMDQLHTLLSEVAPVLSTVAADHTDLENLITNINLMNSLLPKSDLNRDLLLYAWFTQPPNGGKPASAPTTGTPAISWLLSPKP